MRLTYEDIAVICGIAAVPMLVALGRQNWKSVLPCLVMGVFAVYLFVFISFAAVWPGIALWLFAIVYAIKKTPWGRHNYDSSPPRPPGWTG